MTTHKASDAGDADTGEAARKAHRRRSCKEKLVVLAAVEGELERAGGCGSRATRLRGAGLLRQGMDRQRGGGDLGADAGLAAEVREIGGEAVAEVDAGGGKTTPQQSQTYRKARLREHLGMRGEMVRRRHSRRS